MIQIHSRSLVNVVNVELPEIDEKTYLIAHFHFCQLINFLAEIF